MNAAGEGWGSVSGDGDDEDARVRERRRKRRADAMRALDPETLIGFAAAPFWTPSLLSVANLDAATLTGKARAIVESDSADASADAALRLDEAAAAEVGDFLRRTELDPAPILGRLGARLATAELPPVLREWTTLVQGLATSPGGLGERVLAAINAACDRGDVGHATLIVDAAGALQRVLGGGDVLAAVRIGRHRIEHAFRDTRDRVHLQTYVARPDAMRAFDRLLDDGGRDPADNPLWALHYVGVGGAGKSTLIRHLAFEVARDRGLQIARVDFDYLSPAYPARDPGQLVAALVHELTLYVSRAEQDRYLEAIHERLDRLATVAHELRADDAVGPIAWPEFQELLGFVGSFFGSFARPVIILDTCEELMKLAPVGGKVPSVEATFRLIEELHQRLPRLRVIFAGRRLLCEAGANWRAVPGPIPHAFSAPRPYLALHELRGMDEGEARALLAHHLPESRRADEPLIAAILAACPEDDRVSGLSIDEVVPETRRYSPYRVALHGRWLAGDPTLPADRLASGGPDPYIEQRIVQRMGALEPHLPAVALLRRFDLDTFAAAIGEDRGPAAPLFDELSGHEWILASEAPERGTVLEAKRSIADPLEHYLAEKRAPAWHEVRRRVAAALGPRLAEPGAVQLPPELIDAVLRALEPAAAGAAWLALEAGVDDDWASVHALTRFLMGERAAAEPDDVLVGAAVRATQAGALVRLEPDVDVRPLWQQVFETARSWSVEPSEPQLRVPPIGEVVEAAPAEAAPAAGPRPPPPTAWWLLLRARLGLVAADAWHETGIELADLASAVDEVVRTLGLWDRIGTLAAPIVAAAEAVIERAERDAGAERIDLAPLIRALDRIPAAAGPLATFALMLIARVHALAQAWEPMREAIKRALAAAADRRPIARDPAQRIFDWKPPASIVARVRLDALRLGFFDPGLADTLRDLEVGLHADRDTERLQSAHALYRDGRRTYDTWRSAPPGRDDRRYAVDRRLPWNAHVLALVRTGRIPWREGMPLLGPARAQVASETAQYLVDTTPINDVGYQQNTAVASATLAEARARAVIDLVMLSSVKLDQAEVGELIELWPMQVVDDPRSSPGFAAGRRLLGALRDRARDGRLPLLERARAAAVMDEVVALSRYSGAPVADPVPAVLDAIEGVHPDADEAFARLGLRAWAGEHEDHATSDRAAPPPFDGKRAHQRMLLDLAEHAPRRLAQLAYDEAQLLALRLPERAVPLYAAAASLFEQVDDQLGKTAAVFGRFIARRRLGKPVDAELKAAVAAMRSEIVNQSLAPGHAGTATGDAGALAPLRPLADRLGRPDDRLVKPFPRGAASDPTRRERMRVWWNHRKRSVADTASLAAMVILGVSLVALASWVTFQAITGGVERAFGAKHTRMLSTLGVGLTALVLWGAGRALRLRPYLLRWRRLRRGRWFAPRARIDYSKEASTEGVRAEVALATEPIEIGFTCECPRAGVHPRLLGLDEDGRLPVLVPFLTELAKVRADGESTADPIPLPIQVQAVPLEVHAWEAVLFGVHPALRDAFDPHRLAPRAWQVAPTVGKGKLLAAPSLGAALGSGLSRTGVSHAIGRPTRVLDGLRFDLGDERGSRGASQLRPLELGAAIGLGGGVGLALAVLQGSPQAATEQPTDATRLEMCALRELAALVCEQGADAVLALPPTPLATTRALVDAIGKQLRHQPPRRAEVLAAARVARDLLTELGDPAHEAAALEVTVYFAEDRA